MRISAALRCTVLIVVLQSCDIFQTRDTQPPSQGTSCNKPATDHSVVHDNLMCALSESNVENYIKCFVDTNYHPYIYESSADVQQSFLQWNLESEQRSFQNMTASLSGTASLTDSLYNKVVTPGSPSSAVYFLNYSLFVPHQDSRAPKFVRGSMELYMIEDSLHRWSIYRWVDKKTTNDSTWSYLKAWFNR